MILTPSRAGSLGEGVGDVDGVDPTVAGDVEAGEQVVGPRPGKRSAISRGEISSTSNPRCRWKWPPGGTSSNGLPLPS